MTGTTIGFAIWCIAGCFFIALGIYALFSKKPIGFWANAKMFEVIAAMAIYTTVIDKKYRKK